MQDATARRELYLLLARLLGEEPDISLYRGLLSTQGVALPWIEPEIAALPDRLALEALEMEYCRLFVGPYPACPPYASVLRGEAILGGRARSSIEDYLAARGIVANAQSRVASPDHVAIAFAVLAELTEPNEICGWLRDFVLPWVPSWLSTLEVTAERVLFRTVARLGQAVIAEDRVGYLPDPQARTSEDHPQ